MTIFQRFKTGDILFILLLSVAVVHVFYLALFTLMGVREMALFNIGSVASYALILWLYHRGYRIAMGILTTIEVTLHQMAAVYFMGFNSGFMIVYMCMFLFQFSIFHNWLVRLGLTLFGYCWMFWLINHRELFPDNYAQYSDLMLCINIIIVGNFMLVYGTLTTFSRAGKISELIEMLYKDQLTGLHNRKYFDEKLVPKITSPDGSYVLAICDVDDFKKINDTYGHANGDLVLRLISAALLASRAEVVRYGGEEFVIYAPVSSYSEGLYLLDEVRKSICEINFLGSKRLSISIGAAFSDHAGDAASLLKIADAALYRCKENGKNCVETVDLSNSNCEHKFDEEFIISAASAQNAQ